MLHFSFCDVFALANLHIILELYANQDENLLCVLNFLLFSEYYK